MSSASSASSFPIDHVLGVLKSSISCPRRPQIPHPPISSSSLAFPLPINYVLGVDSPYSSASSAFLFPILQPPARPQILNFPSSMSSASSNSPSSSLHLVLGVLIPHRPCPRCGFSMLQRVLGVPIPHPPACVQDMVETVEGCNRNSENDRRLPRAKSKSENDRRLPRAKSKFLGIPWNTGGFF